jgi:hypothetical protein
MPSAPVTWGGPPRWSTPFCSPTLRGTHRGPGSRKAWEMPGCFPSRTWPERRASARPPSRSPSRLAWAGLAEVSPAGGAVADILVKPGPLSAEEERVLSEALDLRARAARAHLDAIGRYANLATCRREHLLSHFGDSAALGAAPCGGCDVCAHAPDSTPPHRRVEGRWPRSPPSSA